jgi:soluble lytic murein transglycosylase-like protein
MKNKTFNRLITMLIGVAAVLPAVFQPGVRAGGMEYTGLSLKAVEYQETRRFKEAWEIWDLMAADAQYPARPHALHLAASARISYLTDTADIPEQTARDIRETAIGNLSVLKDDAAYAMQSAAHRDLARFLLHAGEWTRLLDVTAKTQRDSEYRYMRAEALYRLGRIREAERITQDLFLKPDNAGIVENVDRLYRQIMSDLDKSWPPVSIQQLYQRARALDAIGKRHEAAGIYQQVMDADVPRKLVADAMLFKAKILYDTFQNDACMDLYDRFLKQYSGHASTATVLMRKSIVYRRLGDDQKYLEMVANVVDHHKSSRRVNTMLIGRGDYWRSRGDWDKAESDYQQVIQSNGDNRDQAWWKWVWTAFNRNDPGLAAERMSRMMTVYAGSGWDRPMRYWRARFRQLAGEPPESYAAEYERLATDHAWEYYGFKASQRLEKSTSGPIPEPVPEMTPEEKQSSHVKAAEFLEILNLWNRASAEWETGAQRLQTVSTGYFFRQMAGLVNAGKVSAARQQVLRRYNDDAGNGRIPVAAAEILYPFPERFRPFYEAAARPGGPDPCLAAAVTLQESGFDRYALSHNLAGGLMQVMPDLFKRFAAGWPESPGAGEYMNPLYNVRAGTEYLAWLLERFDGSLPKALAGYNAGEHRVDNWVRDYPYPDEIWIEHIPFQQTRLFVKKILENYGCYLAVYGRLICKNDGNGSEDNR